MATAAIVVNAPVMGLAYEGRQWPVFLYAWTACSFAAVARILFIEEAQRMGETGVGYRNLAMRIRWEVKEAGMRPGDTLPSERKLAARYGTTRVTVRRALQILADEGLVVIVPLKGTFVAHPGPNVQVRTDV